MFVYVLTSLQFMVALKPISLLHKRTSLGSKPLTDGASVSKFRHLFVYSSRVIFNANDIVAKQVPYIIVIKHAVWISVQLKSDYPRDSFSCSTLRIMFQNTSERLLILSY